MDYVRYFWHVHILQLHFHNFLKLTETLMLLYSRDHMDELKKIVHVMLRSDTRSNFLAGLSVK
jgi:hypothetical protein